MSPILEYLAQPTVQWVLLWSALALLVILLFARRPKTLILASSKTGQLEISRHALHRLLETCCEQLNGVASARARVNRRGKKFHTHLRLKVRPDAKLDAIHGYLSEEITAIYRDNLGLTQEAGPITIEIVGVVPKEDAFAVR